MGKPREFIDFATKAKELGITEGTLRARVLSGNVDCVAFVNGAAALAEQGQGLPGWTRECFPFTSWEDCGSKFFYPGERTTYYTVFGIPEKQPLYIVSGWVRILDAAEILTSVEEHCDLNGSPISIFDSDFKDVCDLTLRTQFVESHDNVWRFPVQLTAADLCCISAVGEFRQLSSRKEQTYLNIISAMRSLLMSEAGGKFPSEASLIQVLENRYGGLQGVKKRSLEEYLKAAKEATGKLTLDNKQKHRK